MQKADGTVFPEQGTTSAKVLRHTLVWLTQGTIRIWGSWSVARERILQEMRPRSPRPDPTDLTGLHENVRFFSERAMEAKGGL